MTIESPFNGEEKVEVTKPYAILDGQHRFCAIKHVLNLDVDCEKVQGGETSDEK